jgi:transketolase
MSNLQDVIKTIRVLSADEIEKANSGHPGTPLGVAPLVAELFTEELNICPKNPKFFNRDRFILSAGHASSMLYAVLHLCGFDVTKEDLANFRQLGSRTPGHPEINVTAGVDCSTGPLGAGISNAVGFAVAEKILAAKFNKPGLNLVDHYTYALCGDGCMMEGIENEAASLAGTWKLGKLILFYDSNRITIEGSTDIAFTEDVAKRHEALGWQVIKVGSVDDLDSIRKAIKEAKKETSKPSLIIVESHIGFGSPKVDSAASHGAPLGADAMKEFKKNMDWNLEPFEIPESVKDLAPFMINKGEKLENEWNKLNKEYKEKYPEEYKEFISWIEKKNVEAALNDPSLFNVNKEAKASRNYCGETLATLDKLIPNIAVGSADLGPSNCTVIKGKEFFSPENPTGTEFHFGVREHAMGGICNGMALHGGLVPMCATFFVFSDYMKYSIRMSAMMKLPVTYIFSHDSIAVGEDGPTHQPIEQLAALRSIPGIDVYRPSDALEVAVAFAHALKKDGPTAIITSRQKLIAHNMSTKEGAEKGGYVLSNGYKEVPDVILISSGSEVGTCVQAQEVLKNRGISARVVSMPCMEVFDRQDKEYKESVLPKSIRARVAVEAASSMPWGKYVGLDGSYVCKDTFGTSAPFAKLFDYYGFTAENIANVAENLIK